MSVHSPDDEVDLLIDDVLGEDAESVVVLLPTGRPDVGNCAGHLGGKDCAHWVDLERVDVKETNSIQTNSQECTHLMFPFCHRHLVILHNVHAIRLELPIQKL